MRSVTPRRNVVFLLLCVCGSALGGFAQSAPELVVRAGYFSSSFGQRPTISPDGKRSAQSMGMGGRIVITDVATGLITNSIKATLDPSSPTMEFSRDGNLLAVGGTPFVGTKVFDVNNGKLVRSFHLGGVFEVNTVAGVAFASDDKLLITAGSAVRVWDVATGRLLRQLDGLRGAVFSVAVAPDGKAMATAGADNLIRFWSVTDGREVKQIPLKAPIKKIVFSKNGQILRGFGDATVVYAWNVATGKESSALSVNSTIIGFDHTGETLVTIDNSANESIWNLATAKLIKNASTLTQIASRVDANNPRIRFGPRTSAGQYLAISTINSLLRLPLEPGGKVSTLDKGYSAWDRFVFSPDGKALTTGGYSSVDVRNVDTGESVRSFKEGIRSVESLASSADSKFIAAATADGVVVLDLDAGTVLRTLTGLKKPAKEIFWSADGKRLAAYSGEQYSVWNVDDGTAKLFGRFSIYEAAALSPDGRMLAVSATNLSDMEDRVTIWDVERGVRLRDLMQARLAGAASGEATSALCFSPDGKVLAAANVAGFIDLWNPDSGERIGTLQGQGKQSDNLQFSADGTLLLSVAGDEVALWSVVDRRKIANIYSVGEKDWAVVAPDGRFEATPEARKLMHWVRDGKPVAFDALSSSFDTSDLLSQLVTERKESPVRFRNEAGRGPLVKVKPSVKGGVAEITVEVSERGGGLAELQMRHNNKLVAVDSQAKLKREADGRLTAFHRIVMVPGPNVVSAVAFNSEGIPSDPVEVSLGGGSSFEDGRGELLLPLGQTGSVWALRSSPDGSMLVSLAEDRTAKLWSVKSGREARTLTTEQGFFSAVAFSPNGRYLATGTSLQDFAQNTRVELAVWDVKSGLQLKTFDDYGVNINPGITDVAYSPDSKLLASIVGEVQVLAGKLSRKGLRLLIREVETGRQTRILTPEKSFQGLTFTADGKALIVGDGNVVRVIDLESGKTGRALGEHAGSVQTVSLGPDGKTLASGSADGTTKIWDVSRGALLTTLTGHSNDVIDLSFHPDGRTLMTVGRGGPVRFWSIPDGAPLATHETSEETIHAGAYALGGQLFASSHGGGVIKLWESGSRRERRVLRKQAESVKNLWLVAENGQLIASTEKGSAVWELDRLRLTETNDAGWFSTKYSIGYGRMGESFFPTPDLKMIVVPDVKEKNITVIRTGTEARTKLENLPVGTGEYSWLSKVAVSSDGKVVAAVGDAGLKIWNTTDASEKLSIGGNIYVGSLALNADGSMAAIGGQYGLVGILEIATNKFRAFRDTNLDYKDDPVRQVAFSADGKLLASTMSDSSVKVWDVASGAERFSLPGNKRGTNTILFHSSNRFLLSGGEDGQVRIWNLATGQEVASMIVIGDDDFLVVTPDGYFTASKPAAQAVSAVRAGQPIAFDQFDVKYNRPDIVMERLGIATPETVQAYRDAVQKRLKRSGVSSDRPVDAFAVPILEIISGEPQLKTAERTLAIKVRAGGEPANLKSLQVFVNGIRAFADKSFEREVRTAEVDLSIQLSRGMNRIKLVAVNEHGTTSLPLEFETRLETDYVKPDLYVLAIGVNDYKDARYNLGYAAKDADDIARFFEGKRPRFGKVETRRLLNADATKENIIAAREFLMRAGVDDEVVVFLAGHGMLDKDRDYFFGTYDIDFGNPTERGLRYEDLENLLDGLAVRRKLLMMDTCHSGEVDKDAVVRPLQTVENATLTEDKKSVIKRGPKTYYAPVKSVGLQNSFELLGELFIDLRSSSGTQIVAASSGVEVAFERDALKNGVFTFAVLEALNSEVADLNRDGKIQVFELRDYVNKRVSGLTDGVQRPVMRAENIGFDFNVF